MTANNEENQIKEKRNFFQIVTKSVHNFFKRIFKLNMTIRLKVVLSFVVICAIVLGTGTYTLLSLNKVVTSEQSLYRSVQLEPKIKNLLTSFTNLRFKIYDYGFTAQSYLFNNTAIPVLDINTEYTAFQNSLNDYSAAVGKDAKNKALLKDITTKIDLYKSYIIEGMVTAQKSGFSSKIIDLKNSESIIAEQVDTSLNNDIAWNEKLSNDTYTSDKKLSTDITFIMLILFALSLLIAIAMAVIIIRTVIKPIRVLVEASDKLVKGDMNIEVDLNRKDEFGKLMKGFNTFTGRIKELIADSNMLSAAAIEGKLNIRADAGRHEGDFRKIIEGFNQTLDAVINPLNVAASCVDRISKGDIPEKITDEYKGDFNEIIANVNSCIDAVNSLVSDANMLSAAAVEGILDVRGDATKHQGDFRKIVEGVNATLDAIVEPLNEANIVLDKLSVNDLSTNMSENYSGNLKTLAESINHVIVRLIAVQDLFVRFSTGDTSLLDEYIAIGKRSENDKLIPSCIKAMQSIHDLISESKVLANAAIVGDLSVRSSADGFEGGYKEIIEGMNQTMEAIEQPLHEISKVLSSMENSDFTISMDGEYEGEYLKIKDATNNTIKAISEVLIDMNEASDQVAGGSKQVSDASQSLSQGTSEQASAIEQLSASITEVAAQTRQNAANATEAKELANKAKNDADVGAVQMKDMIKSMEEINESSLKVAKVIKVIDDIAFQTNMLALNAAVEAARAGQHGKGFAVVADEVRNLAARSANAVKETSEMIENSLKRAEVGTKIANNTKAALDQIVTGVDKAAILVAEIAAASNEQATGIAQINRGIEQVAQVVQTNSATAEESAASSEELSGQAQVLKQMVNKFKLDNEVDVEELKTHKIGSVKKSAYSQAAAAKEMKPARKISLSPSEYGKY
jgi:methyl-accepting chemotaxis protein